MSPAHFPGGSVYGATGLLSGFREFPPGTGRHTSVRVGASCVPRVGSKARLRRWTLDWRRPIQIPSDSSLGGCADFVERQEIPAGPADHGFRSDPDFAGSRRMASGPEVSGIYLAHPVATAAGKNSFPAIAQPVGINRWLVLEGIFRMAPAGNGAGLFDSVAAGRGPYGKVRGKSFVGQDGFRVRTDLCAFCGLQHEHL